jgi:uncharacterized protein (TIGR02266 family)
VTDERRNQTRVPLFVEVAWESAAGHYEARTSDVSVGGCFVDSVSRVTEGEVIRFTLQLPEDDSIEVEAIVTYAYPNIGFGVQFTKVSSEALRKLQQLIADRNQQTNFI